MGGLFGQGTVKGGAAGGERRGQCFCFGFLFFYFFLFTLVVKRERTSPNCGGIALKSCPHGSRRHAHARLHAGRSRWHGDLIQLRQLVQSWTVAGLFFCGRVTDYHTCRSESRVDTETHGGGEFGAAGRDQTRRTPINPRNRTAPQIKMHPGHSICVPLPSSQHDFRVGIISSLQENHFTKTIPSLSCQNEILKCIWSSANHFTEILVCTQFERLERERSTNPHLP